MNLLVIPAQFLLCLVLNGGLAVAWFLWISANARRNASLSARLLTAATLFWAQIAIVEVALGLTGLFTRPAVILLNVAIAAVLLYFSRGRKIDLSHPAPRRPRDGREWLMCSVIALAALLAGWFSLIALYFPLAGYDDYAVHLPAIGFVIQSKALGVVPLPVGLQLPVNSFAQLGELFGLWHYAIAGSAVIINIWQPGVLLQLVLAAYVLCRALGGARLTSLFAAALVCFTPVVLFQVLTAYNDICVVAFFATGLALSMRSLEVLGWLQPLAAGAACGLLLASQMTAPLLVVAVLANFLINSRLDRTLWRSVAIMVVAAALIGFYWYVRNAFVFGNPIHPVALRAPGHDLPIITLWQNLQLAAMPSYQRVMAPWVETKAFSKTDLYSHDSTWAGFGPMWFVLGVPSIIAAIATSLTKHQWRVAAMLLIGVAAFVLFPGNFIVRFSLFVLPLMSAAVAWVMQDLAANEAQAPSGWRGFMYRLPGLLVPMTAVILGVLTAGLIIPSTRAPSAAIRQILSPVAKPDVPDSPFFNIRDVRRAIPARSVIAFDETIDFVSPLWRDDYSNSVRFVPTKGTWDQWLSRMQSIHATHVFVTPVAARSAVQEDVSNLRAWISAHPECFRKVATTPPGDLYEFRIATRTG